LLDTTYLLPIFGIDVRLAGFEDRFPEILEEYDVHYNPISLVEAKRISLRLGRSGNRKEFCEKYRSGLGAILADERIRQTRVTDGAIESVADRLLADEAVKDYFDRMIYATAAVERSRLLTEDKVLVGLKSSEKELAPLSTISWSDISWRKS
jgi:PIN domain nuclease of toxin-antitoxin system